MRNLTMIGVILLIIGVAGIAFGEFGYTETKPVLTAGPIQITTQEEHRFPVPLAISIIVLIAGAGCLLAGRKSV